MGNSVAILASTGRVVTMLEDKVQHRFLLDSVTLFILTLIPLVVNARIKSRDFLIPFLRRGQLLKCVILDFRGKISEAR